MRPSFEVQECALYARGPVGVHMHQSTFSSELSFISNRTETDYRKGDLINAHHTLSSVINLFTINLCGMRSYWHGAYSWTVLYIQTVRVPK